jgi:hypothetical protein
MEQSPAMQSSPPKLKNPPFGGLCQYELNSPKEIVHKVRYMYEGLRTVFLDSSGHAVHLRTKLVQLFSKDKNRFKDSK